MSIDGTGIQIGPLKIFFYGILIMTGVVLATFLSSRRAKKYNQDPEIPWDMLPWLLLGGIIGARLWHILTPPPSMVEQGITTMYYLTHPLDAINIRNGGLGILGAVIGGALTLYIFVRRKGLSFWTWTDIIAPGLILAQAIGRWGNFVNQELYGGPSNLPWAIYIDPAHRHPGFENVSRYHPTFLYESILNLMIMAALIWIGNRFFTRLKKGDIFLCYLVGYPMVRFFMEMLRLDSSTVASVNINQIIMLVVAILAAAALILRHTVLKSNDAQEAAVVDAQVGPRE